MSREADWREKLSAAEAASRTALESSALEKITQQVQRVPASILRGKEGCYRALQQVTSDPHSTASLESAAASLPADSSTFGRWLLLQAAFVGMKQLPDIPVFAEVKNAWAEEVLFFAQAATSWLPAFALSHVRFREMARIVTWRRFPAGQFHWEVSGLPRSTFWKIPAGDVPRVAWYWLASLRGFAPLWETHINDRRRNRLTLTEPEGLKSYYRMARSLEMQKDVKGLVTFGWLYCSSTGQVTPRLAWLREFFLHHGGVITSTGFAPGNAGFLVGSEERRRLYEEGRYRPAMTCVLWSRDAILRWASQFPVPDETGPCGSGPAREGR